MISNRDFDYIESRLLAPAIAAGEAHERLLQSGQRDLAAGLMTAMQEFQDACRVVRIKLAEDYQAERQGRRT